MSKIGIVLAAVMSALYFSIGFLLWRRDHLTVVRSDMSYQRMPIFIVVYAVYVVAWPMMLACEWIFSN